MNINEMKLDELREYRTELLKFDENEHTPEEINANTAELRSVREREEAILKSAEERKAERKRVAEDASIPVVKEFKKETEERKVEDNKVLYRSAFLKSLINEELTEAEKRAYVHTTENTGAVVPEELQNKIYSTMEEAHPILRDVQVLRTGAVISIAKHTAIVAGDAKVVLENAANDDEQNTFVNVTLSGKDFSKHVDFSYRLGKMAIPAFEQYLVQEISARIGAAMAADIIAQIKSDLAVANVYDAATPGTLVVGDALKGLGLLKQVGKVNIYANSTTLYNNIATMVDADTKLSFIPNYQDAVSAQLLGKGIKEEDALADGEVLFLDPSQFIYNVVQDIMLERDKDIKKHVHTISGFAIAEGTMTNDKAGAVLTVGTAV